MLLSIAQQKALAILPKISGFTSMIASSLIVWIVAKDKKKRAATYHRLICGSSVIDILSSFWIALSTWPLPQETGRIWAVGTTQTCTAQGFFATFAIGSIMYNASLSLYYHLTIVRGWKEGQIYKIEPYFHAIPIMWALGLAIVNLPLGNYNPSLAWCGTQEYPLGCEGSACIRGEHSAPFVWTFYGSLWFSIIAITINCIYVGLHVYRIEKRSEAYRFRAKHGGTDASNAEEANGNGAAVDTSEQRRQSIHFKRTKQVAVQCFLYAGAFYVTWLPTTVARIIIMVTHELRFANTLVAVMTAPLQGLGTVLVYLRPKIGKYMRENPNEGVFSCCRATFAAAFASSTPEY